MSSRKSIGLKVIFCMIIASLSISATTAKTYYLSHKGSDANTGISIAKAWLTINKVNATKLNPGDSVLFLSGDTFTGNIYIPGRDSGTAGRPVVFTTYGTGKAAINARDGNGFYIYNAGGIVIQNLDIFGSGAAYNKGDGIFYYTDTSNGHKFKFIRVKNVFVHGFGDCGILMGSNHSTYPGFVDVSFTYIQSYDNKKRGILTYDLAEQYSKLYAHKNMYLGHFDVLRNGTDGITVSGVDSGVIEYCRSSYTGYYSNNGDAGIWVYSSNNVTVQHCISDHTYTISGGDGEGFDLDGGCQNCVIQYCYAYQNSSCGFMHCDYPTSRPNRKNVIRYCLSENDGRKAANYNSSFLFISWGSGLDSCYMHNNSAYITDNSNGSYPVSAIRAFIYYGYDVNPRINHCVAMNNIFYVYGLNNNAIASFDGGVHPIKDSNVLLTGNCYYAPISNSRKWVTESKTYTIYKNWQDSAGQEMLAGARKGYYTVDPLWQNTGKAGSFASTDSLWNISAYRLQSKSPLIGKGLNIDKLLPIKNTPYDYYRDTLYPYHQLSPGLHEPQPPSRPIAGFYANNACMGDSVSFKDTSKYAVSYHWEFGDKDTSADVNPSHRYAKAGKYTVTLVARSAYGKTDTIKRTVEQYAKPKPNFMVGNSCLNIASQFKNNSSGAVIYHWDLGDGDTSNVQAPTHSYKKAGAYNVLLTVKTSVGCKDTISHVLQVYPLPKARFSAANICINSISHFTNSSSGAINYYWYFGDGDSSVATNPDHLYKTNASFRARLRVSSTEGCTDTISKSIQIYASPKAQFSVPKVCQGVIVALKNISVNANAYSWQFGDGDTSKLQNPAHRYGKSGTYKIKLSTISINGCRDSAIQTVQVFNSPKAIFNIANACAQSTVSFKDSSIGGSNYVWYFGDGDSSILAKPSHMYAHSGLYYVKEKVSNSNGCNDSIAQQIQIFESPSADWTLIKNGGTYTFIANDTGEVSYNWDFGDSTAHSSTYRTVHTYTTPGKVEVLLRVKNNTGCVSTKTAIIDVELSSVPTLSANPIRISVYPNPFKKELSLNYSLDKGAMVSVKLYTAKGDELTQLYNGYQLMGDYSMLIGKFEFLPSGIYFLKVAIGDNEQTIRLVKIRE